MNRRLRNAVLLLILVSLSSNVFLVFGKNHNSRRDKERASEFVLKDQFGAETALKFPREKIVVLTFADKKGAEQLESWVRPLYERYTDQLEFHGVAELSGVPGFVRGIVRGEIKRNLSQPILLDWSGDVSKSYNFQKDRANIFLIDRQGHIVIKEIGESDAARLQKVYKEIDTLMKSK